MKHNGDGSEATVGKGPFSWSFSRSQLRATCPKAFFYNYYYWDEPFSETAKRVKTLSSILMVAGQVVDKTLSRALVAAKPPNGEMPSNLPAKGIELFRDLVRTSPDVVAGLKAGTPAPLEAKPLHNHYYDYGLQQYQINQAEDRISNCLYDFEICPLLKKILAVPPENWGPLRISFTELPPKFRLDDISVWANYDFYLDDGDTTFLIDWKTGKEDTEKERLQMGVYALYAHLERGYPVDRIFIQVANLSTPPEWAPVQVTEELLEEVRQKICAEATAEMALIKDSGDKWKGHRLFSASITDFPTKASVSACRYCNFLGLCQEGQEVTGDLLRTPPAPDDDPFADE